jgi:hypothetical protein
VHCTLTLLLLLLLLLLCCSALMELLSSGLVDLVFANEDEAAALLDVLAAPNGTAGGCIQAACLLGFTAAFPNV